MLTSIVGNPASNPRGERGFTYILILVALIVMGIMAGTASETAYMALQRDRERQLLFAGFAYYHAIRQFHQANGHYPRALNDLVNDPNSLHRVYLRQLYPDPMQSPQELRGDTGWRLIRAADGGIAGVASRSDKEPLKKVDFPPGFEKFENSARYSEWEFEYAPNAQNKKLHIN